MSKHILRMLTFSAVAFLSTNIFAGESLTVLLAKVMFNDGTEKYYVTHLNDESNHQTTDKQGEVVFPNGDTTIGKTFNIQWASILNKGIKIPIQLDLSKEKQVVIFKKGEKLQTNPYTDDQDSPDGAVMTTINVMNSFGKKCLENSSWQKLSISNIKSIEFYFQFTNQVKQRILKDFSFENYINNCSGSKLDASSDPLNPKSDGLSVQWLYNKVPKVEMMPSSIRTVAFGMTNGDGVGVMYERFNEWPKIRNAGIILCYGTWFQTNGLTIDYKDFPDFPAKFRRCLKSR